MSIILTLAVSNDNKVLDQKYLIGCRLHEDMELLRETTKHNIIVLGRKTYEKLPHRYTKNRIVFILSRTVKNLPQRTIYGPLVFNNLEGLLAVYKVNYKFNHDLVILGGYQTFLSLLPWSDKVIVRKIRGHLQGDKCISLDKVDFKEDNVYKNEHGSIITYIRNFYKTELTTKEKLAWLENEYIKNHSKVEDIDRFILNKINRSR